MPQHKVKLQKNIYKLNDESTKDKNEMVLNNQCHMAKII